VSSGGGACPNCGSALDASLGRCPFCRAPSAELALARVDAPGEGAVAGALARLEVDGLLAKDGGGDALLLDRDLDAGGPLALSELGDALARVQEEEGASLDALEGLLTRDGDARVDGIQLASLLDRGGEGETKVLKRGLLFLRHGKYSEALDWWTLQREALDPTRRRFELLLLLMEAFTQKLAGHADALERTRRKIRSHPTYLELTGRASNASK